MLYAVVDIETTGSNSGKNRIIEVAVFITDGQKIIDEYNTLINPEVPVPFYITSLTGIDHHMLSNAPKMEEVLDHIHHLIHDKVFIAHNVNFDHGFLKHAFEEAGKVWNVKKLCTVRLSRKILPGFRSYSLGNLSRELNITIHPRHRAAGDARATTEIFHYLVSRDKENFIEYSLKKVTGEASLPPNIPAEKVRKIPEKPGVYYFLNKKGKVIYVGKAKNLKKRIISHFNGNSELKKHRKFLDTIEEIDYKICGNELIALLYECLEIKRLIPEFNRAQKFPRLNYGIYQYEDRNGYFRLSIAKNSHLGLPLITFKNVSEARSYLQRKVWQFELCPKLCGLQTTTKACYDYQINRCKGACNDEEGPEIYNLRLQEALESFNDNYQSYMIIGKGRNVQESSVVLVENGVFKGFGFVEPEMAITHIDKVKDHVQYYPDNQDIQRILAMYLRQKHKDRVIPLDSNQQEVLA